jgi:hypothetical protein
MGEADHLLHEGGSQRLTLGPSGVLRNCPDVTLNSCIDLERLGVGISFRD